MILIGLVLGLVLGLLVGGSITNLANVRLRWSTALFAAVVVRFGTEAALNASVDMAEQARLPLFAGAFALLLLGLWANRRQPGIPLAFVGILANAIAVVANGGFMPIWIRSLEAIGLSAADVTSGFHTILGPELGAEFLLRAGPLVDIIPLPILGNVASIGDVFLAGGLAFFLFATLVGPPEAEVDEEEAAIEGRLHGRLTTARLPRTVEQALGTRRIRPETGLAPGLAEASALERPLVLAGSGAGLAGPAVAHFPTDAAAETAVAMPRPPAALERARRHPYVRLALNGSFSALWVGQLISLFGDRVHQVALAFLVLQATNSPIAVGFVFVAATLPNLLLGPIAGTFVDRWDQKEVMVVSDLLRAALVLVVPVAAVANLALIYPLVFLITAISIFFRPARTAVMPRIVRRDELLTANSATWVGETLADVVGYPLAGLFVAFLGSALPLAFWLDAATYLASAILIATIVVPRARRTGPDEARQSPGFVAEMREGWRFLRREAVLLANTLQATVGQFALGVTLAVMPVYARDGVERGPIDATAAYAFLETGVGIGNLVGGFVIGLIGARLAKGRMVIVGYTLWGLCTAALALTGHIGLAIGLTLGSGIANMVFVIPSQTLFQERTPAGLIGRVVGFRFAIVFGSLTIAMAVSGILAEAVGPGPVLGAFGLLTMAAGLAGLLVPAVRNA